MRLKAGIDRYGGKMYKILVIEDERSIAELLKYGLEKEGFLVETAGNGQEGVALIDKFVPHVILLDLMLPDVDGLSICKYVTMERNIPILIVSARNDQVDKLIGLEYGADDYITKPFDIREVILRIKSILRRINKTKEDILQDEILTAGDIEMNLSRHEVKKAGEPVDLTPKEFALLEALLRNCGKVMTRSALLERVWEFEYLGDTRTVDIHIQRLRKKIRDEKLIVTVFGMGYKIAEENQ